MGVDLNIWSNHNLEWSNNPLDIIEQVEKKVNSKIGFYNLHDKSKFGEKKLFEEIEYYCLKNNFESNFKDENVQILLDYEFLCSIRIYKKAMRLSPIRFYTKWHKWTSLVSKEYLKEEEEIKRWNEFYQNWKNSHLYLKSIIAQFGGNEIYYINDYTYESKEDLLCNGVEFKTIKKELEQIGNSHELNYLFQNHEEVCSMKNWFYEQISSKSYKEFRNIFDQILLERRTIIDNDPAVYEVWKKLTKLLSVEIELTNRLLMDGDLDSVSFVSEVMEEVYFKNRNRVFLKNILQWDNKYPNLKLKHNIEPLIKMGHET